MPLTCDGAMLPKALEKTGVEGAVVVVAKDDVGELDASLTIDTSFSST